jgi:photosystem II stability/assembly factor-like uncharacterized protein
VMIALAGMVLLAGCGSGSGAPGKDAGNVSAAGWQMIVPPTAIYKAVWLDAAGTIYAVAKYNASGINGAGYSVTSSHDDGKTWTTVALTDANSSPIMSVAAVGPTDVYAVGYTYDAADPSPLVAKSRDRGATFTLFNPTFTGSLNAVAPDVAGNPIGVGSSTDGGFFVRSTDGGATWSRTAVAGSETLWSLWTTASGTIYACGQTASASAPLDGGTDAGRTDGGADADAAWTFPALAGVVVSSDDGGNTWTTLITTAPSPLFAISGTSDGRRIVAVGGGFTEIESDDGGATWQIYCGRNNNTARNSSLGSVWVPDSQSAPFIAAGNAPYVVRALSCDYTGAPSLETWEPLPLITGTGVQSGAIAVAGSPTEIWAVGTGIFRRM